MYLYLKDSFSDMDFCRKRPNPYFLIYSKSLITKWAKYKLISIVV